MKHAAVLVLVLLFVLSGCGVRWQVKDTYIFVYEIEPGSPEGYVLPVPLAQVSVSGEITAVRYTDASGRAHFQLPPGTYTVAITKNGYLPLTDTIVIYTLELTPGRYVYYLARQGG
ncbi:carboxypeptidase regulatory-like domain-containing protein [Candidatus Caldatribacterium saccharofermentans]|uniref:Carboxypeptidase regulatory-like domain-containing protein n=1 Tax=Candidatus Caldatribacterium saccharofermentans TaxID=1454753 RepID=A0A7V4WM85_9BACT